MSALDLSTYDWIVVSSSSGKDSQTTLRQVYLEAKTAGVLDRVVVVHCDLGRVEWPGCKELAEDQAKRYGLPFLAVKNPREDLLQRIERRKMWPSSTCRFCTSDFKRGQADKVFTELGRQTRERVELNRPVRILSCMGMRAQESPARAKLVPFEPIARITNSRKHVDQWLPIHGWVVEQVWEDIRASEIPHHVAYDLGMPRLSCVFCIFSPKAALLLAGQHNRELLGEYVRVEREIGHTFRKGFRIEEIQEALDRGDEVGKINDWVM